MARLDDLLRQMKQQGASDLHVASNSSPYMRIHGEMVKLNYRDVSPDTCRSLIFEILTESQKQSFEDNLDLDLSYPLPGVGRFRVNVFMQRHGMAAVFRLIPEEIKTIKELDLPEQLDTLIDVSEGLVLVTGPTGSGKSTTLASLIHTINVEQQAHIITIEDPIEFVHENQRSLINQREVASHTRSFSNALRAALREDPDIILVGEMRDLETIALAITAAETGHLVLSTLHTIDASKTVERIAGVFPLAEQQVIRNRLAKSVRGIVSQRLIPRKNGSGRVAAIEILRSTLRTREYVEKGEGEGKTLLDAMRVGGTEGMQHFDGEIEKLIRDETIDFETGMAYATNAGNLRLELADFTPSVIPSKTLPE